MYNIVNGALRVTGENLIERITAREMIDGKPIRILRIFGSLLEPLRQLGLPIEKYFGVNGLKLSNHSFGWISTMSSGEIGPFEVYRRTENGHLVGEFHSYRDSRFDFD